MSEAGALFGHLHLRPGAATAIVCERPMVAAALMQRLTADRHASLVPDLLAAVFTLGAHAHRATAWRAVRAACAEGAGDGAPDDVAREEREAREARALGLYAAREHLQRLALDIPTLAPQPGVAVDTAWLRDAPVLALPSQGPGPHGALLDEVRAGLAPWLERRLLGMPAARWLEAWQASPSEWLHAWARQSQHPVARWLTAAHEQAIGVALPCRPLDVQAQGPEGWQALAAALRQTPDFAVAPTWRGAPAETGPWTRAGQSLPVATLWDRLGSRVAEVVRVALGHDPAMGALTLAAGEGMAWSEMSRGLLVHWVRLEGDRPQPDKARIAQYRVLAPTEWNFHPDGALGRALREGRLDAAQARLAAVALDPCIAFDVEAGHA